MPEFVDRLNAGLDAAVMNGYNGRSRKTRVEEDVEENDEDEEMEDDEGEANADLSLDIVAKAAKLPPLQVSLPFEDDGLVKENPIFISSSDEETKEKAAGNVVPIVRENAYEIIHITDGDAPILKTPQIVDLENTGVNDAVIIIPDAGNMTAEVTSKKKKRKKKKMDMQIIKDMQEPAKQDTGKLSNNDLELKDQDRFKGAENMAVRDLLRPRRYFDPPEDNVCFNCGKPGHIASECSDQHPRPCYICGNFEHKGKNCPKMSECHYCGNSGHKAKACPQKNKAKDDGVHEPSEQSCLHCGENGHEMSVCRKDYHPDDLKIVKCYICKQSGHLCCQNILGNFKGDVSCYNCGEFGHSGMGCAKSRHAREKPAERPAQTCYKCGEEGHYARGCMKAPNKRKRWPEPWDSGDRTPNDYSNGSQKSPWLPEQPPRWMGIQTRQLNNWNNGGTVSYNGVFQTSGFAGLSNGYLYQNQNFQQSQNLLGRPHFLDNAYQTSPLNRNGAVQRNIYKRWQG